LCVRSLFNHPSSGANLLTCFAFIFDNLGAVGRSYCDRPLHDSWYFDPLAASGKRWTKAGTSKVDRLYATLLPDGSVLVSGSNPNPDYVDRSIDPTITYVTEYRVEKVSRLSRAPLRGLDV
jgi:hypothetical protein